LARKRMIDPNFWESEDVSKLSVFARLLFIGMFSNADDYGKGRASAAFLKSAVFKYDNVPLPEVEKALEEIVRHTALRLYEVAGNKYYIFRNWGKWQKVPHRTDSNIPDPVRGSVPEGFANGSEDIHERIMSCSGEVHEGFTPKIKENKLKEIKPKEKQAKHAGELEQALQAFTEHRKKRGKPMTEHAKALMLDKLKSLAGNEREEIDILNRSIVKGWTDIYPLENRGAGGHTRDPCETELV